MTKRAEYGFYVREHRDGTPWIIAEWISGEDILDGGVTGLTLTINGHSPVFPAEEDWRLAT